MWRQPRSIALADAIPASCGGEGTLHEFAESEQARPLRLLEINKAGTLSPRLRRLPGHVFGGYPALDMQAMSYPDASSNLIAHCEAARLENALSRQFWISTDDLRLF
jgi:hypothetical protein